MRALTHLIFPSICPHCQDLNLADDFDYCMACRQMLSLINPVDRCPLCFKDDCYNTCDDCRKKSSSIRRMAAAFENRGLPASMIKKLSLNGNPRLAQDAAAFLVLQLSHLNWPPFDLITPMPHSWLPKKTTASSLLAKALATFFERPVASLLKRKPGDLPRSRTWHNKDLKADISFSLKTRVDIADKTILLVDDVIHTGETMRTAAETLQEGFPKAVYGIAFCRS